MSGYVRGIRVRVRVRESGSDLPDSLPDESLSGNGEEVCERY